MIKVTRKLDGFHWEARDRNGDPVTRNGKHVRGGPFDDAWEAGTAGHSAMATYDREHSYIVEEIQIHYARKK